MAPQHRLYTPAIADEILEMTEAGASLNSICSSRNMPSRGAVQKWITNDHEGFGSRYARAHAVGLEALADEILDIADRMHGETEAAAVQAAKLRVDSRKWILSKLKPDKYGDKLDVQHSGGIDLAVLIEEGRRRVRGE